MMQANLVSALIPRVTENCNVFACCGVVIHDFFKGFVFAGELNQCVSWIWIEGKKEEDTYAREIGRFSSGC